VKKNNRPRIMRERDCPKKSPENTEEKIINGGERKGRTAKNEQ